MSKLKLKQKKRKTDDKTEYFRQWCKKHPNYFKKYYKKNAKAMTENTKRYLQSEKGKASTSRYEHSEKRMKAKREWQQENRRNKSRHD